MPKEATQFKKGQSGNPKGRPKGSVQLGTRVRQLVSDEALAQWYRDVWEGKIEPTKAQEAAAAWLGEYGWGKAPTHAPIEDGDPLGIDSVQEHIERLNDELAARRKTKLARPQTPGTVDRGSENGAAFTTG